LGLAALYRNKIPDYKRRIYTTITRGKNIIFFVPRGTSRVIINAAIRDVVSALSEVERPTPLYYSTVLNLKAPKNSKFLFSNLKRSRTLYLKFCLAAYGGTAGLYGESDRERRNMEARSVGYRPARFWPQKPRITALARLF